MHLHVLVQVGTLREAVAAAAHWALVWALVRVNAEVVEEVVPLAEVLAAVGAVALQDLDVALALGVLEGEDTEVLRGRHVLLDLHRPQVEGLARLHRHTHVVRDALEGITQIS